MVFFYKCSLLHLCPIITVNFYITGSELFIYILVSVIGIVIFCFIVYLNVLS